MVIQIVKYKSGLSDSEALRTIEDRLPQFKALPGLLQKYYMQDKKTGVSGGIYVWDSEESMQEFRQSDLARSISAANKLQAAPEVEIYEVTTVLR